MLVAGVRTVNSHPKMLTPSPLVCCWPAGTDIWTTSPGTGSCIAVPALAGGRCASSRAALPSRRKICGSGVTNAKQQRAWHRPSARRARKICLVAGADTRISIASTMSATRMHEPFCWARRTAGSRYPYPLSPYHDRMHHHCSRSSSTTGMTSPMSRMSVS
ncbi:hypothetical protein FQZ97_922190 [compost metagenome]